MGPYLRDLAQFVAIPSVSAQPRHAPDVRAAAHWLTARLRGAGLTATTVRTGGHPVVLATWHGAPQAPTVLIYGHYDVQPPGLARRWSTPPFTPVRRGDRLHARGASDDKGQLLCHVAALRALLRRHGRLPVNVTCLFEGEEEIASPSLPALLDRYAPHLAADVLLVSDTAMPAPGRPAIVRSLRGSATLDLRVTGPATNLHSGTYGGAVHNPAQALCTLIAGLHDPSGRVRVPGFYAGVRPLTATTRDDSLRRRAGVPALWGLPDATPHDRTTIWPALSVHGLRAGYTGPGTSSIIPHAALARLGIRVAPGQNPAAIARAVTRHLRAETPETVRTTITTTSTAAPILVPTTTPGLATAAAACREVFGTPPVFTRSGGTIPALGMLREVLGLDPVLLGFALPGDNPHGPDESVHLPTCRLGVATIAAFLRHLGHAAPLRGQALAASGHPPRLLIGERAP